MSQEYTEYEIAQVNVKLLAHKIKSLTGTERELGTDRIITQELYNHCVREILDQVELVYRMTPAAEAV